MKKANSESWERSVGTLSGRGSLGSLVVRKKPSSAGGKPPVAVPASSTSPGGKINLDRNPYFSVEKGDCNWKVVFCFPDAKSSAAGVPKSANTQNGSSSLSLLGAYSDSDSNDSE